MSSRKLNDWLSGYLEYTNNTEPPKSYHVWIGLSVLASALQRKVYMDWNFQRIFPNMYVVLVGPSGRCKKGTAMNMGKDLMQQVKSIKVTANSTTREALIKKMVESESSFINPDETSAKPGGMTFHCSITCLSDELSVFLGQNDIKFLANLTDWYDCHDLWAYETRGRGEEEIKGVCLNLLGGTAPDWFQSILPEEAIGGGFTSRIFFIAEDRKRKTVPIHQPTEREGALRISLIQDLERISKLRGFYSFTDTALEQYIEWYQEQDQNMNDGIYPVADPRFAGYCDRRATHVKKLSMIFAASRSDNLVIDVHDFERAIEVMVKAEKNMPKAFSGLGSIDHLQVMEKVIRFFQSSGGEEIRRSALLVQFYRDMDPTVWELIKNQLQGMKYIQIILDRGMNPDEESYIWKGPKA